MNIRNRMKTGMTITLLVSGLMILGLSLMFARLYFAVKRVDVASRIVRSVSELEVVGYDYIFHHDQRQEQQWELKHAALSVLLDEKMFYGDAERSLLQEIRWNHEKVRANFHRLDNEYNRRVNWDRKGTAVPPEWKLLSNERETRLIGQLLRGTQTMVARASQLESRILSQTMHEQRAAGIALALCLSTLTAVVVLSFRWTTRSMMRTLPQLQQGAEIIGNGNLEHRIGVTADDEIGEVARAFDQMAERLSRTTAQKDDLEREVLERKKAQAALEASRETMNSILNASPVGITLIEKRSVTWANEAFRSMFGFATPEDFQGKSISILFRGREEYSRTEGTLMEQDADYPEVDTVMKRQDGNEFPARLRISSADPLNPFQRAVLTVTDETWRIRAQSEQIQRDRLQGALEMAGSVCHELNQPLQYLLGTCELHLMRLEEGDEEYQVFAKIKRTADRMAEITKKLMGITKYETVQYGSGISIIDIHQQPEPLDGSE